MCGSGLAAVALGFNSLKLDDAKVVIAGGQESMSSSPHYQNLRKMYSFEDLCKTPELAAEVACGPMVDFDYDVSILFSDILFPLDYLGMGLTFNPGPQFSNPLTEQILNQDKEQSFSEYIKFQIDGLDMIRDTLPKNKSLIGFVGGLGGFAEVQALIDAAIGDDDADSD